MNKQKYRKKEKHGKNNGKNIGIISTWTNGNKNNIIFNVEKKEN